MKLSEKSPVSDFKGFTLLELLVVVGAIAILVAIELPALAGNKSQSKIGLCASHVRQLALACQIYANDNSSRLPALSSPAAWAWDLPTGVASGLLAYGAATNTFYCPGTAPRFTDKQNWSGAGTGPNTTLWNYDSTGQFRVIGYAMAFSGTASVLNSTNQNTTMLPETIKIGSIPVSAPPASERVLVADATISTTATLPGYAHPENNYVSIVGGFQQNGATYPMVSPHLQGNIPAGGNLGFKDGHVAWRKFEIMTPRTVSGAFFWW